jgi:hypothetical protein
MGIMAGIGGLVGGLGGLFGGSNVPGGPQPWLMPGMDAAAGNAFSGIQGLGQWGNLAGGTIPNMQSTFQNLYNNPNAGSFLSGANTASGMGMTAANNAFGAGGQLLGAGLNTLPMAGQIFNTAFDPQGALYNRTLQQNTDQTRAAEAARGISTTPYGAGLENQATSNFNIDWQNNQLQRQALGAQAGGGLLQAGGNLANLGAGIQNAAPGQFLGASGMPFGAWNTVGQNQNQAIAQMLGLAGAGQGIQNVPIQDWLSYLQTGNQAGGVANQAYGNQLQANQQQWNQQMQLGGLVGGSLYGLGQGFPGGNAWGNMFGGAATAYPPMGGYNTPYAMMGGQGPFLPFG